MGLKPFSAPLMTGQVKSQKSSRPATFKAGTGKSTNARKAFT
jgi:hypothetical protein